jgi:hypothetical protein
MPISVKFLQMRWFVPGGGIGQKQMAEAVKSADRALALKAPARQTDPLADKHGVRPVVADIGFGSGGFPEGGELADERGEQRSLRGLSPLGGGASSLTAPARPAMAAGKPFVGRKRFTPMPTTIKSAVGSPWPRPASVRMPAIFRPPR